MMISIIYITKDRNSELYNSILSCEKSITITHEYIIIDNNNDERTLKNFLSSKLPFLQNLIHIYKTTQNLGVSESRNIGYSFAKGEILYFIDDDAYVFNTSPILDEVYTLMTENNIYSLATDIYDTTRKYRLVHKKSTKQTKLTSGLVNIKSFVGCSHFINKSLLDIHELYDPSLFYGSEELYFALKLYSFKCEIFLYDKMLVIHSPSFYNRKPKNINRLNGHINTAAIKTSYHHNFFIPLIFILFILRMLKFSNFNLFLIFKYTKLLFDKNKKLKRIKKLTIISSLKLWYLYGLFQTF